MSVEIIIESQSMVILYYPVDAVDLFLKFWLKIHDSITDECSLGNVAFLKPQIVGNNTPMHTCSDACGFGLGQSCHKYNEEDEKEYQYAEYLDHQPSV